MRSLLLLALLHYCRRAGGHALLHCRRAGGHALLGETGLGATWIHLTLCSRWIRAAGGSSATPVRLEL